MEDPVIIFAVGFSAGTLLGFIVGLLLVNK